MQSDYLTDGDSSKGVVTAPSDADCTSEAYFANTPLV